VPGQGGVSVVVKDWFSRINEQLLDVALQGGQVPGHKVVRGTKHKAWSDEASAMGCANDFMDPAQFTKIRSPAQVLKACKTDEERTELKKFITKPEGEPTLVKNTDRREAISVQTAQNVFEPLD